MSEQHTPGPWILATLPTSVGSCHKIGPFPSAGSRPYTFAFVYADGIRPGIDDNVPAARELAANARLIAAAPELLAALRLMVAAHAGRASLGAALDEAQAAITQATGGTQP